MSDMFESLDDAAADANDSVLSAAVAEVNACYDELARFPADSESVFARLQKAAAVVRHKLAERDAKRAAATGLSDAAIQEEKERKVKTQVATLMKTQVTMDHGASKGNETDEALVDARAEIEKANGAKIDKIFERICRMRL